MAYGNLSDEERLVMSGMVMGILTNWGFSPDQKIAVLALPSDIRTRNLRKFSEDTPLPDTPEVNERIEHILGIESALRTSYPTNASMGRIWMKQPHKRFKQRTPIHVMLEDGLNGVIAVRSHLDCAFSWRLT